MWQYLLLVFSAIGLGVNFVGNKFYQVNVGDSVRKGLIYNVIIGVLCGLINFGMNGFRFEWTPYSSLMALVNCILLTVYSVLGLMMMARGKIALYSMFLLIGGMVVPYIYGLAFLDEMKDITQMQFVLRIVGIVILIGAIALINFDGSKPDKTTVLLGTAVFFLNGFVSCVSKMHQIADPTRIISTTAFNMLYSLYKVPFSLLVLIGYSFFMRNKSRREPPVSAKKYLIAIFWLIVGSAASAVSGVFLLDGAKYLPATVVYPFFSGGGIICTSLVGCVVFKEKITKKLIISLVLCLVGTCMFL